MMTTWAAAFSAMILATMPVDSGQPVTPRSPGLQGLIRDGDTWTAPEAIVAREREDARLAAIRADYAERRAAADGTAEGQRALATWCELAGLRFESLAHFEAVSRLDPEDTEAHRKLGHRRYRNRWMTESEAVAEVFEANAQKEADARWSPRIAALRVALTEPATKAEAARELLEIRDPRAFAAIRRSFGDRVAWEQVWAVRILDHVDSPRSTREIAWLSVFGIDEGVRLAALRVLESRDPRAFVGQAIRWFRDPVRYQVGQSGARVATLTIEGQASIVERHYRPSSDRGPTTTNPTGKDFEAARTAIRDRQNADIKAIDHTNSGIDLVDARVERTLFRATGVDLGQDPQAWNRWWQDEQGYSYQSPPAVTKPIQIEEVQVNYTSPPASVSITPPVQYVGVITMPRHACFGAGTSVASRTGPRPIEDLRVGDQVLTQDTGSGSIDFRPILAVFHNKPASTLRVSLDGQTVVVVTPIHRFWVAGKGWAMARDLKPGDRVRKLGGTSEVTAVVRDVVQPVFNLEVAGGHSFFVGTAKALVHDNSPVLPVAVPFDR